MKTLILVLCMTTVSYATEFKFETVSVAGALATIVDGLNDLEDVVGRYGVVQPFGVETGFLLSDGKSTALTINGSQVEPRGINDNGVITGLIIDPFGSPRPQSFILDGNKIKILDVPVANAINNLGHVVGWRHEGLASQVAYVYKNGKFFTVDIGVAVGPAVGATAATGINERNHIVGYYYLGPCCEDIHGFLKKGERVVTVDSPFGPTTPLGINNRGDMVGVYRTADTSLASWYYRAATHQFEIVEIPGSALTIVHGLNNHGQIAGYTVVDGEVLGFVGTPGREKEMRIGFATDGE
jgi:probable HAF family extracellular repeat protein